MATPESSFVFESAEGLITGFIGPETIIDIPLTIGGVLVNGIGYNAFYHKTSITSITATSNVSYIGASAFGGCTSLTTLNIPGATYIRTNAFAGCTSLTSISLPNAVALESYAFVGSHFTSLNLPEVATIGTNAFDGCTSLTSISIPKATSIPYSTFYGCTSLTSITIPNSVTSIGEKAFYNCSSLASITIPDGVTSIGNSTFYNCSSLTSITIPDSVTSIGNTAFYNCTSLTAITIPDSVTSIEFRAFQNCPITVTITNPTPPTINIDTFSSSDLVEIEVTFGSFAAYKTAEGWSSFASKIIINSDPTPASAFTFDETTNTITAYTHIYQAGDPDYYKNVIIPEYINVSGTDYPVNNIDIDVFKDNTDITGICTASTTIMLNNNAFLGCINLTKAYCENVTTFGLDVFNGCTSLDEVLLSNSLTSINVRTFQNCSALTAINLSNTITSIGDAAFQNCYILALTNLPTSLETIGQYAFTNCQSITTETIPETVTSIGQHAFANCYSISNIIIPASINSIAQYTFIGCNILETVSLPNTLISIGDYAFAYTGLIDVTIPASVYSIGNYAFDCSTLSTITELSTTPPELGGSSVFGSSIDRIYVYYDYLDTYKAANIWSTYSTKIKAISTPQSDFTFDTATNTITDYNHTYTVGDPDYYKNIIIPDAFIINGDVYPSTNIGNECFINKTGIERVIIQDSTITLSSGAFRSCTNLIEIIIPSSVTSIGNAAFYECLNLTTIILPEGITSIENYTFDSCSSLTSINIPNSVTSIGIAAFRNCESIDNIIIPEGVTSIETDTFRQCSSLTNITIPLSVVTIKANAFNRCSSLKEIIIPGPITSIEAGAFYMCNINVIFYTDIPATILSDTFEGAWVNIFVFYGNLTTYKTADIWSTYSDIIKPLVTPRSDFTFDETTKTIISYNHTYVAGDLEYYQQVVIPDSFIVNEIEYPTEIIGAGAFIDKNLQKVVIQPPIVILKSAAFRGCSSLTEVIFPNTLTTLEDEVFYDCVLLEEVNLPNLVASLGEYCLYNCDSLTAFTFPPLITTIPSFMFGVCNSLETINFNESITFIDEFAFEYCSALETITIPNTVLDTGIGIFLRCTSLSSVTLPNSLTAIKSKTFEYCTSLTNFTIPETIESIGYSAFSNSGITTLVIPSSVYRIYNECFRMSNLINIIIPDTVTILETEVFKDCTSLTTASISNSISTIPDGTFNGCTALTNFVISDYVTSIGNDAFKGCSSIEELIIPINVSTIGYSAFSGTSITTMELSPSVSTIGHNAFENCISLTTITVLRKTHPTLDGLIFQGCTALTKIYIKKNIYLNDYITSDYWITYASLFDCLIFETDHSYFIFNKETNTVEEYTHIYQSGDPDYCIHIVVPEYFTIDNIEYPSTYIGEDCFSSVDAATSIEFQETVTSIGTNCFYNCPDLVSIIIPKSVSEIKDSPILDCNNLESIVVDPDNVSFTSESGVLFNESKTSLIVYPSNRAGTTYLVENNILEIKNTAFNNCNNLLFLKVSSLEPFIVYNETFINYNINFKIKVNITKVDDYKAAWSIYSSIIIGYYVNEADFVVSGTTITLYIGTETGNLLIPSNIDDINITGIANTTFNTNNDFSNIVIPYTITNISNNTFGECSALSNIEVEEANTAYMSENGILYNKAKTILVSYPRAKLGYSFIIPNTVTSCSPYAFNNCSNLTSITNIKGFGEGTFKGTKVTVINVLAPITQFYNYAFKDCDMLTTVTYSGTITSIGIESFYGCSNMTDFSIPITTTSIGDRAFYGCTKLRVVDSYNIIPPTAGVDIFDGTSQYLKITVDSDSLLAYRAAWSEYALYIYSKEPILPDFLSTTDFINIVSEQNIIDGNITIINPDVIRTSINNTEAVFILDNKNKNLNKLIEAEQILINKIVNKVN